MRNTIRFTRHTLTIAVSTLAAMPLVFGPGQAAARDYDDWHHEHEVIRVLPRGHTVVRVGHEDFFVHEGRFYRRGPGGFVVIAPPYGQVVATLPVGFATVTIAGAPFFVANGVYYQRAPHGYVIVEAPPGAVVPPQPWPATVVVQVPSLNVRQGPSGTAPVIAVVASGQQLPVQGAEPGWYYVQLPNGQHGWVVSNYVVSVPPPAAG